MRCWFCDVRDAETEHVYQVEMYGDVDTRKTPSQTQVAYNVRHVEVPRCADCHSRHVIAFYALVISLIMVIALAFAILAAVLSWTSQWIWGLWAGLAAGLLLGTLLIRFLILKGIRSIHQARITHPEIKDLLEKCYRFGRRPKGSPPKSDKPCDAPSDQDASGTVP